MDYPFTYPAARSHAGSQLGGARRAMRLTAAGLYAAGALTMGLSIATPQPSRAAILVLAGIGVVCVLVAAYLLLGRGVPDAVLLALPALGAVVVSAPMAIEETATGTPFFYLWPGLMAALFMRLREFLATLAWISALFAAILIWWVQTPDGDAIYFIDAIVAIGITCGVVFALKTHVVSLIDQLRFASRTDPLTGVLNRRAFEEALEEHATRGNRFGEPFVLALIDLDHFKQVNDRLGHAAGDRALVRFAQIVLEEKRHDDALGRLGGEEFGLLLADTDLDGAHSFADRLRATIRAITADDEARLSVSIGLAPFAPGELLEHLLRDADAGLYAAKAAGRNRVVISSGPVAA